MFLNFQIICDETSSYIFERGYGMKRALVVFVVFLFVASLSVGVFAAGAVPSDVLSATESVVRILAEYSDGYGTGSGFVIKSDSESTLIATNYHVVEDNPHSISVWISDEETITAKILAYTDQKDMCILELAYPISLAALRFADVAEQGEAVYAVGFPAAADYLSDTEAHTSAEATITDGIISAVRESTVSGYGTAVKILQINAAINPGNSGGPLFNSKGEVVGINTYGIGASQGIFGAIDVSELKAFMADNNVAIAPVKDEVKESPMALYIVIAAIALAACVVGTIIILKKRRLKVAKKNTSAAISLRTYMEKHPEGIDRNDAVSMLMPVALKLRDLHNDGKSHLQVSPDSIYVSPVGAELHKPTDSEAARYTSGYAAPEVYKGTAAGNLSDIYSFCAVLSYAISGVHPENSLSRHNESTDAEVVEGAFATDELVSILDKGMALSVEERYETMQEIIIKLSPFNVKAFVAESVPSDSSVEVAPTKKKKSRIPKLAIVGVAIIVVLGAVFGVYWGNYSKAVSYVDAGDYKKAKDCLLAYDLTQKHDPELISYIEANELLAARKYNDAKSAFEALGEYRDAAELVNEADYRHAAQYADANDFQSALDMYTLLSEKGYKDSADKVNDTNYRLGIYTLHELENYSDAYEIFSALNEDGYEKAEEMCNETQYLWAWEYADNEEYIKAYNKFITIEDYSDVDEVLEELSEVLYLEGQLAYQDGRYSDALERFVCIPEYSRSKDYILLLCVREVDSTRTLSEDAVLSIIGYRSWLPFGETGKVFTYKNQVNELISLFYFEDAAELLLLNQNIAEEFLLGKWKSNGGYYSFEMEEDGGISYMNLPFYTTYEYAHKYYYIENGEVRLYENDSSKYKVQFTFTLLAPDCMEVFCHKNNSTEILYFG